jgi:hypothetical protein
MPAAIEYIWKGDQTGVGTDMRCADGRKNRGRLAGRAGEKLSCELGGDVAWQLGWAGSSEASGKASVDGRDWVGRPSDQATWPFLSR